MEDLVQLVNVTSQIDQYQKESTAQVFSLSSFKDWFPSQKLSENTSNGPDIDSSGLWIDINLFQMAVKEEILT
jgi:hypothetical protein